MFRYFTLFFFVLVLLSGAMQAQPRMIQGRVVDAATGDPLPGANIVVSGEETGTSTDSDGRFSISVSSPRAITVSHLGYKTSVIHTAAFNGGLGIDVLLLEDEYAFDDVTITSTVSIVRWTPVAVSSVGSIEIGEKLGARDFPEMLKHTPGVYATRKGGGFGDSELRLRGFKQENIAVMVNGVPMNDMEHGGVYWSNWAGLADVARSVQVQRGLGAAKVSAPSVGGSVNIITNALEMNRGGFVSYEMGDHSFTKATFSISTGVNREGWAMTLLGGYAEGDGYIQGTEFEAYNWFVNIGKRVSDHHRVNFTAFGAPQQHNQRSRMDGLSIAEWERVAEYMPEGEAHRYNPVFGYGRDGERRSSAFNKYHKPQFSLNHLWQIGERSSLSTAVYASFGRGYGYSGQGYTPGSNWNDNARRWYGTGNLGVLNMGLRRDDGTFDYAAVQALNEASGDGALMAMTRSVNDHNWIGLISTFTTKFGRYIDFYGGVDVRNYRGIHTNEIDDLYGAAYFNDGFSRKTVSADNNIIATAGDRWISAPLNTGDIVVRDYDGYVNQRGLFAQAEYNMGYLNAFVAGSASRSGYSRYDRFFYDSTHALSEGIDFWGGTVKAGANYNIGAHHNLFANIGYISRAPFFSGGVFLSANTSNVANPDAVNEKIFSMEAGYGFRIGSTLDARINAYRTMWMDKTMTKMNNVGMDYITLNMTGANVKHEGVEVDVAANPLTWLELTGMLSAGWWSWQGNAEGWFYASDGRPVANATGGVINYASGIRADDHARTILELDRVKVGGAAQTTASLGVKFKPLKGLYIGVDWLYYGRNYADWSFNANDLNYGNTVQYVSPWEMPEEDVYDLSAGYGFNLGGLDVTVSGNIFNLFNKEYIVDATDGAGHNMETAYGVFYGFGRTGSVKVRIGF